MLYIIAGAVILAIWVLLAVNIESIYEDEMGDIIKRKYKNNK